MGVNFEIFFVFRPSFSYIICSPTAAFPQLRRAHVQKQCARQIECLLFSSVCQRYREYIRCNAVYSIVQNFIIINYDNLPYVNSIIVLVCGHRTSDIVFTHQSGSVCLSLLIVYVHMFVLKFNLNGCLQYLITEICSMYSCYNSLFTKKKKLKSFPCG